jgi:hypothetical protein
VNVPVVSCIAGKRGAVIETNKNGNGNMSSTKSDNDVAAAGGGVEDAYGEDRATEEQQVTPWSLSVAR